MSHLRRYRSLESLYEICKEYDTVISTISTRLLEKI